MAQQPKSLTIGKDRVPAIFAAVRGLTRRELLVGVPSDRTDRQNNDDDEPITNAAIGYINENGSPSQNIPARPHLVPGIARARPQITAAFRKAAQVALDGDTEGVDRELARAGFAAVSSVRRYIEDVIPPPLAPATLKARADARFGRLRDKYNTTTIFSSDAIQLFRDSDQKQIGVVGTTPLLFTGEYRKSITYVLRGGSRGQVEGP